jgi:general secretion pathway protein M
MKQWWSQRQARERSTLTAGAVVVVLVLVWVLAWEPWTASRDQLRVEVQRQAAELSWMRPAVGEALARGGMDAPVADGRSLLARVDAGLRESGLGNQLVAVEPQGQGRVSVRLSQADFDRFAQWLEQQVRAGLHVESLSVQRAASGVDIRVELREGLS